MSPILDLLNEIRSRPLAIYLGEVSLTMLASYLRGYEHAVMNLNHGTGDSFLGDFGNWVRERFHVINQSWEKVILFQCVSEQEGVHVFWKLIDEFVAQTQAASPEAAIPTNGAPSRPVEKTI